MNIIYEAYKRDIKFNESNNKFNWKSYQSKYTKAEKGIILAWGHLLYLSYSGEIKNDRVRNLCSQSIFIKEFEYYFDNAENDEDLMEWMTEPVFKDGTILFDGNRLHKALLDMSYKTKSDNNTLIYRWSKDHKPGWNSYTIGDFDYSNRSNEIKNKHTFYLLIIL